MVATRSRGLSVPPASAPPSKKAKRDAQDEPVVHSGLELPSSGMIDDDELPVCEVSEVIVHTENGIEHTAEFSRWVDDTDIQNIQREAIKFEGGTFKDKTDHLPDDVKPLVAGNHHIFARNKGDVEFAAQMLKTRNILLLNANFLGLSLLVIHDLFWMLCSVFAMCPQYLSRGSLSSSINTIRTTRLLSIVPFFRYIIEVLKSVVNIVKIWVSLSESGWHPWHADKFGRAVDWRGILNFGCNKKMMWIRCKKTGRMFGIAVPHAAFIVLSKIGGGMSSDLEHSVRNADYCWTLIFEMGKK